MLSFIKFLNNSWPIAQIQGGKLNSKIIFVNPDSDKGANKIQLLGKSKLFPFTSPFSRQVIYIAGPSGSGKSTYAFQYIVSYFKLFPKNNVYVFSRLEIDPKLAELGCIQIPIDQNLETIDIIKHIKNALCLFDDIDTIPDKNIQQLVFQLQNDILETGRKNNIYIIITSHLINGNDKKNMRTVLNEAHQITFFPNTNFHAISYLLKEYLGFNKKQIDNIVKIKSRWITVDKNYPQVCFYQNGACILSELDK